MSQARKSPWVGFTIGVIFGIFTRDNYLFSYSEKINMIHENYEEMRKSQQLKY